jgi:hypothetical protein
MITAEIELHDWRQIDHATGGPDPEWVLSHVGGLPRDAFKSIEEDLLDIIDEQAQYPRDHESTVARVEDDDDRNWTINSLSIYDMENVEHDE